MCSNCSVSVFQKATISFKLCHFNVKYVLILIWRSGVFGTNCNLVWDVSWINNIFEHANRKWSNVTNLLRFWRQIIETPIIKHVVIVLWIPNQLFFEIKQPNIIAIWIFKVCRILNYKRFHLSTRKVARRGGISWISKPPWPSPFCTSDYKGKK